MSDFLDTALRLTRLLKLVRGASDEVALATSIDKNWEGEKVNLMTIHSAKGLEFDVIFLPGWEEGLFPHQKSIEEKGQDGLEEERRLAYVGITRAKKLALISFSMNRYYQGDWIDSMASRFIGELPEKNLQEKFDQFTWSSDEIKLEAWQKGETGYPIVDAGMRELWKTGYMHNRTRMITASFLVKNLMIHWHHGERWFWDTLLDADLANNSASWQWVAGCGADAAPYFRIFNPIIQGEKFDPNGEYVKKYVPELSNIPNKFIHKPWEASPEILSDSGVELGENYPHPIVDLKQSRDHALSEFKKLSG